MPEPVLIHRSNHVEVVGVSLPTGDWVVIQCGSDRIEMPWVEFCRMVVAAEQKIGGGREKKQGVSGEDF